MSQVNNWDVLKVFAKRFEDIEMNTNDLYSEKCYWRWMKNEKFWQIRYEFSRYFRKYDTLRVFE